MKYAVNLLMLLPLSNLVLGQKIYRASNEAYSWNKFSYEFYFGDDSTCFLKGHSPDTYFLYKGRLKKSNDSLYEFKFQPIVWFGSNKRVRESDSVIFHITQKDTSLASMNFVVILPGSKTILISLQHEWTSSYIKNAGKKSFIINTKFIDPLTKKIIYLTVDPSSAPDLTYYGMNTKFGIIQISIRNNKLVIYPDHKFIHDKESFLLKR